MPIHRDGKRRHRPARLLLFWLQVPLPLWRGHRFFCALLMRLMPRVHAAASALALGIGIGIGPGVAVTALSPSVARCYLVLPRFARRDVAGVDGLKSVWLAGVCRRLVLTRSCARALSCSRALIQSAPTRLSERKPRGCLALRLSAQCTAICSRACSHTAIRSVLSGACCGWGQLRCMPHSA